jgi:hypothetical protein
LLRSTLDAIATVGTVLAVPGATTIGIVVHTVITLFTLVHDTVATVDAAVPIAVALVAAILGAFVAFFTGVDCSIAAGAERNPAFAVLHT